MLVLGERSAASGECRRLWSSSYEVIGTFLTTILDPISVEEDQVLSPLMGAESLLDRYMVPWKTADQGSGTQECRWTHPASLYVDGNNKNGGFRCVNNLFSCSLSKIFSRKLNMSAFDDLNGLPASTAASDSREEELIRSVEEMEAQAIENLLPDEDELLSGIFDDLELFPRPGGGGDAEDELFCTGGGWELEAEDNSYGGRSSEPAGVFGGQEEAMGGSFPGEHPHREHPSRTLSVRNVDSNADDSELTALFEPYGDIRSLYTACKNQGFVMISYYDMRSAWNAMRALQSTPLRQRKLDIHFSAPEDNPSDQDINQGGTVVALKVDSSVLDSDLHEILRAYGDIKEILETPYDRHHRFIEFYDVRAASAALLALNRGDQEATGFHQPRSPSTCQSLVVGVFSGSHPPSQASVSLVMEGSFPPAPFGILPGFPSNPVNHGDRCGPINPGLHSPPTPLPHSLPAHMAFGGPEDTGAFGTPGNGSYPLNGNQQIWGDLIPGQMMWLNPMPLGNLISSPPPLRGLFRAPLPPNMLRGPPPLVNPSLWLGSPGFPPGSSGSVRSAGGYPRHHLRLASHSLLPLQNRHIFHASDRSRRQSNSRRQYELNIERIIRGEDSRTTLMIKNIPNKYTSEMLSAAIGEHHRGTYDFLYLPIDFKNNCNMGYAFINMIDSQKIIPVYQAFNGKKWEKFNSDKVASLAYARIQGKAALIAHFKNSSLMNEDIRCRPILFRSDGPNAGDPEPFPVGVKDRPGPSRPRTVIPEEDRSPSVGKDAVNRTMR
ncbi:unnamed protein product [Spirodela intermedia]|uniref:RRM domain-containing protein n=1 Tax=Spirodela intermedia TaxID=51605 RepID=A0A7I8KF05_SPIIN|nr:unnamed protein product [Spirodela intermedia]